MEKKILKNLAIVGILTFGFIKESFSQEPN